ncbi:MAG: alpha-2-macroglobulin, partial [Chloroflexi bacterium]|nr:alpha-2-macroglobulin [Chloroflexota bacterium]
SRNGTALQPEQLDLRAYILYVLAETGQGDTGLTVALYERREALSTFGRAYLAMALKMVAPEGPERLAALTSDLAGRAILSATGAHWQDDPERPWQRIYLSTDTRTTALALQALVRIDPQNLLIPGTVRWLMAQRRFGEWSTTQETATSILAFTDFMVSTGELQGNYNYTVSLNGKEVLSSKVDAGNITQSRQLVVPVKDLVVDQANKLVLQREGQGRLYYAAYLTYFRPAAEVEAQNQGIVVSREYRKVDQTTLESTGEAITTAHVGEVVEVHLTVIAPNDLHYVTVEDPLPAGMEALDTSLKTTSSAVQGPTVQRTDRPQPYWYYWVNSQLRDEKVVLFSTFLPRGAYEYTYQTRASVAGEFNVIPLHAAEMYFPEVFGSSAGTKFTIQP